MLFNVSFKQGRVGLWEPISDGAQRYDSTFSQSAAQTALSYWTSQWESLWVISRRCVCVLVSHPSSVSLMMSQISMLSVQSSFCREPSVAFSVRNKPHTDQQAVPITDTNKHWWNVNCSSLRYDEIRYFCK